MTEDEIDRLPELLRAGEVLDILRLSRWGLQNLKESDSQLCVVLPGMKRPRYSKQRVLFYLRRHHTQVK
jgi:hypothetical protein